MLGLKEINMKPIHPACAEIPRLLPSVREALKVSLADGWDPHYSIVTDPAGQILDGRHREELCAELGISPTYRTSFEPPQVVVDRANAGRARNDPAWPMYLAAKRGFNVVQIREACGCSAMAAGIVFELAAKCPEAYQQVCIDRSTSIFSLWSKLHPRKPRSTPAPLPAQSPAAPVEPDPLEAVRRKLDQHATETADKRALKIAAERLKVLEAQLQLQEHTTPLTPITRIKFGTVTKRQACAVALLSDVHAGATVTRGITSFDNRYNPAIARLRLGRFFAGVEWLINSARAQAWHIHDLVLWYGGDLIDGHLHQDQQESSETSIRTIDWLEPILVDGARRMADNDLRLQLICSYGNHGRDSQKTCYEMGAEHSYEWGMYRRIKRALAPHGIEVNASPEAHQYCEVYDKTLHFTHGDQAKYNGGVGGITIPLNKAFGQWDKVKHADIHHCGHYHTRVDNNWWLANGSVIGYNPFSMGIKGDPAPPEQTFYLLDSERGKTCVSPIWVSDAEEEVGL
jgi:hypothetical protein